MEKFLYIIVLNWNGADDTINCLTSLQNLSSNNHLIILVDNGSDKEQLSRLESWCENSFSRVVSYTDKQAENGELIESENIIANEYSASQKIVIIKNSINYGYAEGNNIALRYVINQGGEYALLLNNDTVVNPNSVEKLFSFLINNDSYCAVTPQIRYYNNKNKIWNCGGKIKWYGNRKYLYANRNIEDVPQTGHLDISYITGCALLLDIEKTGIYTEKFFFSGEDFEFSLRQRQLGNKMACVLDSVIYHKVHGSVLKVSNNPLGKAYIFYLSRFINNRQYVSRLVFVLIVIMNLTYAIPMIKIRYKVEFGSIFRMVKVLLKELRVKNSIDKEYCFYYFNEKFQKKTVLNS